MTNKTQDWINFFSIFSLICVILGTPVISNAGFIRSYKHITPRTLCREYRLTPSIESEMSDDLLCVCDELTEYNELDKREGGLICNEIRSLKSQRDVTAIAAFSKLMDTPLSKNPLIQLKEFSLKIAKYNQEFSDPAMKDKKRISKVIRELYDEIEQKIKEPELQNLITIKPLLRNIINEYITLLRVKKVRRAKSRSKLYRKAKLLKKMLTPGDDHGILKITAKNIAKLPLRKVCEHYELLPSFKEQMPDDLICICEETKGFYSTIKRTGGPLCNTFRTLKKANDQKSQAAIAMILETPFDKFKAVHAFKKAKATPKALDIKKLSIQEICRRYDYLPSLDLKYSNDILCVCDELKGMHSLAKKEPGPLCEEIRSLREERSLGSVDKISQLVSISYEKFVESKKTKKKTPQKDPKLLQQQQLAKKLASLSPFKKPDLQEIAQQLQIAHFKYMKQNPKSVNRELYEKTELTNACINTATSKKKPTVFIISLSDKVCRVESENSSLDLGDLGSTKTKNNTTDLENILSGIEFIPKGIEPNDIFIAADILSEQLKGDSNDIFTISGLTKTVMKINEDVDPEDDTRYIPKLTLELTGALTDIMEKALIIKVATQNVINDQTIDVKTRHTVLTTYISEVLSNVRAYLLLLWNHKKDPHKDILTINLSSLMTISFPSDLVPKPTDSTDLISKMQQEIQDAGDVVVIDDPLQSGLKTIIDHPVKILQRKANVLISAPTVDNYMLAIKLISLKTILEKVKFDRTITDKTYPYKVPDSCRISNNGELPDFIPFEQTTKETRSNMLDDMLKQYALTYESDEYWKHYSKNNTNASPIEGGLNGLMIFERWKAAHDALAPEVDTLSLQFLANKLNPSPLPSREVALDDYKDFDKVKDIKETMALAYLANPSTLESYLPPHKGIIEQRKNIFQTVTTISKKSDIKHVSPRLGPTSSTKYNLTPYLAAKMENGNTGNWFDIVPEEIKEKLKKTKVTLQMPPLNSPDNFRRWAFRTLSRGLTKLLNDLDNRYIDYPTTLNQDDSASIRIKPFDFKKLQKQSVTNVCTNTQQIEKFSFFDLSTDENICKVEQSEGLLLLNEENKEDGAGNWEGDLVDITAGANLSPQIKNQKIIKYNYHRMGARTLHKISLALMFELGPPGYAREVIKKAAEVLSEFEVAIPENNEDMGSALANAIQEAGTLLPKLIIHEDKMRKMYPLFKVLWKVLQEDNYLTNTTITEWQYLKSQLNSNDPTPWASARLTYLMLLDDMKNDRIEFRYPLYKIVEVEKFKKAFEIFGINKPLVPLYGNALLSKDEKKDIFREIMDDIDNTNGYLLKTLDPDSNQAYYEHFTKLNQKTLLTTTDAYYAVADLTIGRSSSTYQLHYELGQHDSSTRQDPNNIHRTNFLIGLYHARRDLQAQFDIAKDYFEHYGIMGKMKARELFLQRDSNLKKPLFRQMLRDAADVRQEKLTKALDNLCSVKEKSIEDFKEEYYMIAKVAADLEQKVPEKVTKKLELLSEHEPTFLTGMLPAMAALMGGMVIMGVTCKEPVSCGAITRFVTTPLIKSAASLLVHGALSYDVYIFSSTLKHFRRRARKLKNYQLMQELGMTNQESVEAMEPSVAALLFEGAFIIPTAQPAIRGYKLLNKLSPEMLKYRREIKQLARASGRSADTFVDTMRAFGKKINSRQAREFVQQVESEIDLGSSLFLLKFPRKMSTLPTQKDIRAHYAEQVADLYGSRASMRKQYEIYVTKRLAKAQKILAGQGMLSGLRKEAAQKVVDLQPTFRKLIAELDNLGNGKKEFQEFILKHIDSLDDILYGTPSKNIPTLFSEIIYMFSMQGSPMTRLKIIAHRVLGKRLSIAFRNVSDAKLIQSAGKKIGIAQNAPKHHTFDAYKKLTRIVSNESKSATTRATRLQRQARSLRGHRNPRTKLKRKQLLRSAKRWRTLSAKVEKKMSSVERQFAQNIKKYYDEHFKGSEIANMDVKKLYRLLTNPTTRREAALMKKAFSHVPPKELYKLSDSQLNDLDDVAKIIHTKYLVSRKKYDMRMLQDFYEFVKMRSIIHNPESLVQFF
ncbi:MAG: hypothetical protein ISR65_10050 [Bacteriovoracaceae bacterium]|nr:hypothetical protein [Bacteriovoracaceae bacterium]